MKVTLNRKEQTVHYTSQYYDKHSRYYTEKDLPVLIEIAEQAKLEWYRKIQEAREIDPTGKTWGSFIRGNGIEIEFLETRCRIPKQYTLIHGMTRRSIDDEIGEYIAEYLKARGVHCHYNQGGLD